MVIYSYISYISERYWDAVMNVVALKPLWNKTKVSCIWTDLYYQVIVVCHAGILHSDMSMEKLSKISHTCLMISVPLCSALQTSELLHQKDQVVLHWNGSQKLSKLLPYDVWELLKVSFECRDEKHRSQIFKILSLESDISALCQQKRGKSSSKTVYLKANFTDLQLSSLQGL